MESNIVFSYIRWVYELVFTTSHDSNRKSTCSPDSASLSRCLNLKRVVSHVFIVGCKSDLNYCVGHIMHHAYCVFKSKSLDLGLHVTHEQICDNQAVRCIALHRTLGV